VVIVFSQFLSQCQKKLERSELELRLVIIELCKLLDKC